MGTCQWTLDLHRARFDSPGISSPGTLQDTQRLSDLCGPRPACRKPVQLAGPRAPCNHACIFARTHACMHPCMHPCIPPGPAPCPRGPATPPRRPQAAPASTHGDPGPRARPPPRGDERPGTPRGGGAAGQGAGAGPSRAGLGRAGEVALHPPRLAVPSRARGTTPRTRVRAPGGHVGRRRPIAARAAPGCGPAPGAARGEGGARGKRRRGERLRRACVEQPETRRARGGPGGLSADADLTLAPPVVRRNE